MPADLVTAIQRFYPQIYLACHVDHVRARSTAYRLSTQDASLLAHLDDRTAITAGELARHLGIVPSTLSAAIKRLERLGYLARTARGDRREVGLKLTSRGEEAMGAASVLDRGRLAAILDELSPGQRRRAIAGLGLLARAARSYQLKHPQRST